MATELSDRVVGMYNEAFTRAVVALSCRVAGPLQQNCYKHHIMFGVPFETQPRSALEYVFAPVQLLRICCEQRTSNKDDQRRWGEWGWICFRFHSGEVSSWMAHYVSCGYLTLVPLGIGNSAVNTITAVLYWANSRPTAAKYPRIVRYGWNRARDFCITRLVFSKWLFTHTSQCCNWMQWSIVSTHGFL